MWGLNARITVITSLSSESCGQCFRVSSAVFEKPKSYPRAKYWCAPSIRRAARSSSVRITPSASPSSLPIRFWPPSPRVSDKYAVSTRRPRASHAISWVSSSSGCAAIHSTRIRSGAFCTRLLAAEGSIPWAARRSGRAQLNSEAALSSLFLEDRCSGFDRHAAALHSRRMLHRRAHLVDDALLLLLVHFSVTLRGARAVGTSDIPRQQRVSGRHPQAWRHIRPRALVLRLLLCPDDFLDRRIKINDLRNLVAGPWIKLLHSDERDMRGTLRGQIVVDLARAEHKSR